MGSGAGSDVAYIGAVPAVANTTYSPSGSTPLVRGGDAIPLFRHKDQIVIRMFSPLILPVSSQSHPAVSSARIGLLSSRTGYRGLADLERPLKTWPRRPGPPLRKRRAQVHQALCYIVLSRRRWPSPAPMGPHRMTFGGCALSRCSIKPFRSPCGVGPAIARPYLTVAGRPNYAVPSCASGLLGGQRLPMVSGAAATANSRRIPR